MHSELLSLYCTGAPSSRCVYRPYLCAFSTAPPPTSHPHALIHYLHGPCSIVSQSIVASLVSIRLLLHSALKFENEDGVTGNKVSKEIGNVTADTTLSFE